MTKLVIPIILSITILVAGIFAFAPFQQASTVHGQIIDAMILAIQNTVPIAFIPLADDHDNIDDNLTEIDTALATVDGIVDDILEDTDMTLPGEHDTIQANTLKFSVVTGTADDANDVVTITCPVTSEGCLILDVLFDNNGGADLVIDDASVTIDAFTGDPSFDVFTADVTIPDGVTQYLDEVSGISFGAGDTLVITPTGGSTSDDWSVQVIADVQGDVDDIEIDVS